MRIRAGKRAIDKKRGKHYSEPQEEKMNENVNEEIDISDILHFADEDIQEHKEEGNVHFPSENRQEDKIDTSEKIRKKKKPKYKILIIGLLTIGIIAGGSYFMLNKDEMLNKLGINKTVEIQKVNEKGEITEEYAKQLAVEKFKELKEEVKVQDLSILKIERAGEEYYYITSAENSLEVKLLGSNITRVNSVPVQ